MLRSIFYYYRLFATTYPSTIYFSVVVKKPAGLIHRTLCGNLIYSTTIGNNSLISFHITIFSHSNVCSQQHSE